MKIMVGLAVLVLPFAAQASDLPNKKTSPEAPVAANKLHNWNGFFIGGSVGLSSDKADFVDTEGSNATCWARCGYTWSASDRGELYSVKAGYNVQSGNLVIGVVGEVGVLSTNAENLEPDMDTTFGAIENSTFGSVRGRLGYAFGNELIYISGGALRTSTGRVYDTRPLYPLDTGDEYKWGAAFGGGFEHAINENFSLSVEYLHYNLGKSKVGSTFGDGDTIQYFDVERSGSIFAVGINYKF